MTRGWTVFLNEPDLEFGKILVKRFSTAGFNVKWWLSQENVSSDGTLENAVTARRAFEDIASLDLLFTHATAYAADVGERQALSHLPDQARRREERLIDFVASERWGRIVLYSSVGGSGRPETGPWPRDAFWVIPALSEKNPPDQDAIDEFKTWLEGGDLPSLLRPSPALEALVKLSVTCQGFLAAWAAANAADHSLDHALDRMGWCDLLTIVDTDVAPSGGLVDFRGLAAEFAKSDGSPIEAGWWQDFLGQVRDRATGRSFTDDVLDDLSGQPQDNVMRLLSAIAADAKSVLEPSLVADAFVEIANALGYGEKLGRETC